MPDSAEIRNLADFASVVELPLGNPRLGSIGEGGVAASGGEEVLALVVAVLGVDHFADAGEVVGVGLGVGGEVVVPLEGGTGATGGFGAGWEG